MSGVCESSRTRILDLAEGRKVCVAEYGARGGVPVIALHGTPGSRLKYAAADATASSLGLRLISPDRWGYGGTDVHPKPSLSEYARDTGALADLLGLDRFALIGISGGGPYALAAAAQLGSRILRLALVAPVGPISDTPPSEMRPFHRFCFRVLPRIPGGTRLVFRGYRRLLQVAPKSAISVATFRTARADIELAAMADIRTRLAATFREGLCQGAAGPVIDLKLFSRAWDIRPGDIQAATRLWLGSEDRNVPQSAVRLLAQKIPQAELIRLEGQGHLWVLRNYGDVLGWVAGAE
jgi:pimeloyl-ACP methyl ester carboxylesterase